MTKLEKINITNYSYKFFGKANKPETKTVMKTAEPQINLVNKMNTPKFKTLAVASVLALSAGVAGFFSGKNAKSNVEEEFVPAPIEQKEFVPQEEIFEFAEPEEQETVYVVKENDNIWAISKARLQQEGINPKNSEINDLKNQTIKMNPQVKNGGDLIHAGDELKLPALDIEI